MRSTRPMAAEIQIPAILKIGVGAFSEVAPILVRLNCSRPLIVTDAFIAKCGLADKLHAQILAAGFPCEIFSDTVPDPTTDAVNQGLRAYLAGSHDSLVSIGGGSSIDTAK